MPLIDDDPFGGIKREVGKTTAEPKVVSDFHGRSDVDSTVFAQHHTLGIQHNQASFGDHTHNGRDSFLIAVPPVNILGTGVGQMQAVIKPSNTDRSNSGALSADPHLVLPIEANATYLWELFVGYSYGGIGATTSDLSYDMNVPSGTNFWDDDRVNSAVTTATVETRGYRNQGNSGNPVTGVASTNAAAHDVVATIRPSGSLVVGITPGNLTFRWCQATSNATGLRVWSGSWIRALRIS